MLLAKQVTATRPVAAAIAFTQLLAWRASSWVRPATIAFVESPTIANTPSSPILARRLASVSCQQPASHQISSHLYGVQFQHHNGLLAQQDLDQY